MIESIVILSSIIGSYGLYVVLKVGKYKISKRKLKKMLLSAFNEDIDVNLIKKSVIGLLDFDKRNNSNKTSKYLEKVIRRNPELNLNEENVRNLKDDLSNIENIFDIKVEVKKEEDKFITEQLKKIERKRKEVILRKNELLGKTNLKKQKIRRNVGKMG